MNVDQSGSGEPSSGFGKVASAAASHAGASTMELLAELRAWAAEVDRSAPGARQAAAIKRKALASNDHATTHPRSTTRTSKSDTAERLPHIAQRAAADLVRVLTEQNVYLAERLDSDQERVDAWMKELQARYQCQVEHARAEADARVLTERVRSESAMMASRVQHEAALAKQRVDLEEEAAKAAIDGRVGCETLLATQRTELLADLDEAVAAERAQRDAALTKQAAELHEEMARCVADAVSRRKQAEEEAGRERSLRENTLRDLARLQSKRRRARQNSAQLRSELAAVKLERDTLMSRLGQQVEVDAELSGPAQRRAELAAVKQERDVLMSRLGQQTGPEEETLTVLQAQLEAKDVECKRLASVQVELQTTIDRQRAEISSATAALGAEADAAKAKAAAFELTIQKLEARCQSKQHEVDALEAKLQSLTGRATTISSSTTSMPDWLGSSPMQQLVHSADEPQHISVGGHGDGGSSAIATNTLNSSLGSNTGTAAASNASAAIHSWARVLTMQTHGIGRDHSLSRRHGP